MNEPEPSVMFCLDCMFKHSRDLEHHMEDAVRVDKKARLTWEEWIDKIRELRKYIQNRMTKGNPNGNGECGCQGIVNPTENPNPELAESEKECEWTKEEVKPKEYFHPDSFRTLAPKCPEQRPALCPPELICSTRIIIGCKADSWDEEAKRCKVSTETHTIYHSEPK